MASSPTPSLRLELQGTGDNSGTWGTKANENFTLIDVAIAGYLAIDIHTASGGNYTLSANNYASDESRNAMIAFTGALTGNVNVVVPTATQKWDFINSTSGSFTVTVKTVAGTGVAITQGKQATLYCDGVNVQKLLTLDVLDGSATVSTGGTGVATLANHGVVIGQGTSPVHVTGTGSTGQVLMSNGAAADPTFQSVGGGGTLGVPGGGTGQTSLGAHGVVVGNNTSAVSVTGTGSVGQVLTSNGASSDPTFQDSAATSSPVGAIVDFAGSSAPTGWLMCSGAAVSRATYAGLFAVVSTTYGSGDGSTTFNLPDLRGRLSAGVDNMGGSTAGRITNAVAGITGTTLGAAGGSQSHTLTVAEMPAHTHSIGSSHVANDAGSTQFLENSGSSGTSGSAGGGAAHAIVQPTIMLNKIIKT